MNYCYRDLPAEILGGKKTETALKKSIDELAEEVIAGLWGAGDERKKRLGG